MGVETNIYYNAVVEMVEYHINILSIFQDSLNNSVPKGKYVGWLNVRTNKGKHPVICMEQDKAIFKQYFSLNKVWKYNGDHRLSPKDEGYGLIISGL